MENVPLVVSWLRDGKPGQKYQAALAMRGLASNPGNKKAIREAGGIQGLLENLEGPPNNSMTVVSAETISCLIADDLENRVRIGNRHSPKIVDLFIEKLMHRVLGIRMKICTSECTSDLKTDSNIVPIAGYVRNTYGNQMGLENW